MILYKSVYGALHYVAYGQSQAFGGLFYLLCEIHAYAAYYVYGQPGTAINHCVALEELCETVHQQVMYFGITAVLVEEWRKTCQETVGQWFVIHAFQYVCYGEVVLLQKFFAQL